MDRLPLIGRMGGLASAVALAVALVGVPVTAASPPTLVKDIRADGDSEPQALTRVGDLVYFVANDGTHGRELWKTDGTPDGTALVKDIRVGAKSAHPGGNPVLVDWPMLVNVNGTLFFTAIDGTHANAIWKSGGTVATTRFVVNAPTRVQDMLAHRGKLLYLAGGLWFTDGTTTKKLKSASIGARGMWKVGSRVFFVMDKHLWKTDGTAAGTIRLSSHVFDNTPNGFTAAGSQVTFVEEADAQWLWATNGTVAGTHKVRTISAEETLASGTPITGRALYTDRRLGPIDSFPQLWVTNATKLGTKKIKEWADGHRTSITAVGGTGWVAVAGPAAGGFWTTDGTAAGTTKVLADTDLDPYGLSVIGTDIWFAGNNGTTSQAPHRFDTTTGQAHAMGDVMCGLPYSSLPPEFTKVGNRVVFVANDESSGAELWSIDLSS